MRDFLESDAQEMAPQGVHGFLAETFRGIEQLLDSGETHLLSGAVIAIHTLMEVEAEDVEVDDEAVTVSASLRLARPT